MLKLQLHKPRRGTFSFLAAPELPEARLLWD